jgi:hypothetical protein
MFSSIAHLHTQKEGMYTPCPIINMTVLRASAIMGLESQVTNQ